MPYDLIVVGTSMGGLAAIQTFLMGLPADFEPPIAIVQHRSVESTDLMTRILRRYTTLALREPHDKEPIEKGCVYIAPPDYHLMVEPDGFALSTEGVVTYARPSIDVLFDSAADVYKNRLIGIVLTGANHDGAHGATRIKQAGGIVIVQHPATAESSAMPKAAIKAAKVDFVLGLSEISQCVAKLCGYQVGESGSRGASCSRVQ